MVSMTVRVHPFPSRTRQLSSLVSTILGWKRPGTIDRCQHRKDLLHDVRRVFRFVCGCLRRKMAEIRYRYGAEMENGPLPDGIVRRTGWTAVGREMEPFLRGEEICHPPQFPAPEVRLPIGAVGRMGTGSSTDLTVVGSHPVCRHFPREHMGNSSVAAIFRENIWGTVSLPSFSERTYGEQLRCRRGCFLFWGATIWAYRGALRRAASYTYGANTASIWRRDGERPAAGWDRTANRMKGRRSGEGAVFER